MFRMFANIFRPHLIISNPKTLTADEELKKLSDSLDAKRKIAIERLGSKWLLHPDHHIKNQGIPANTLGFKSV